MKKLLSCIFLVCQLANINFVLAQDCIDSTLLDPSALCPLIWDPVCGCNGVTYANACEAVNYGGVTSYSSGECPQLGCPNLAGLDFGLCDMFLGFAWTGQSCTGMSGCGYFANDTDYSPYFFATPEECQAQCGGGECISQQQLDEGALVLCTADYNPVCGCNGQTYSNECVAYYTGGTTTLSLGACDGTAEYCPRIPAFVDFGDCDLALGWGLTTQGCIELSGCDYIGSNGYDYSSFFYASSYECGNQCIGQVVIECYDSTAVDVSIMCPAIYEPVCGCDSVTYSNSCVALYHNGITMFTPGECTTSVSDLSIDGLQMNIYPNPAVEQIQIQMQHFKPGKLYVFDMNGKLVLGPVSIQTNLQVVQLNELANGLYVVEWKGEGQQTARTRMIKSKN